MFIGTALVVLVLVGMVLFFYRPTRVALERAEAFRFRRMLVTRLGEQGAYRFFYVTNRHLGSDDVPLEERFGNKREGVLKFGLFDTQIEPTLGLGMLINPTDWFQNEEIQLKQVQSLDKSEFIAKLRQQVQSSPLRSILINVNGFRERFPSALRKTAFLSHVLDINSPVLADAETEIEDVVLTAPDVDRDEFDRQFKREIAALTRNLTVYVSSNDRALLISRVINRGRRLGEATLNPRNPDQFEEAARVLELVEPDSELVTLVDVTPVNRTRNFHNFSLETPEFFDDLFLRLTNTNTPSNRLIYQVRTADGAVYWVLTRGR
jgi:esterase/lipase superfamily enzyme